MDRFIKHVLGIATILLGILLIGWTGIHTYDILYKTNPLKENAALPWYGLILFEGGAIVWFGLFLKKSEGMGQHAIALMTFVVDLVLVIVAFVLDNTLSTATIESNGSAATWTVIIATIVNISAYFSFEISNPKTWDELMRNLHVADIMARGMEKARQKLDAQAETVAEEIGQAHTDVAIAKARDSKPVVSRSSGNRPPQASQPSHDNGQVRQYASETRTPPFDKK